MKKEKNPSEGEKFIADYLKSESIKFETEVKIMGLRNDPFKYRRADFFLTDLNVYIEFYGGWNNSKEERERYRAKKNAYHVNEIPCIYLYPENLGIIDYTFSQRLTELLKKTGLTKKLFKYRFNRLKKDRGDLFIWFILASIILIFGNYNLHEDKGFIFVVGGVLVYQLYRFYIGYNKFFKRTKHYSFN